MSSFWNVVFASVRGSSDLAFADCRRSPENSMCYDGDYNGEYKDDDDDDGDGDADDDDDED